MSENHERLLTIVRENPGQKSKDYQALINAQDEDAGIPHRSLKADSALHHLHQKGLVIRDGDKVTGYTYRIPQSSPQPSRLSQLQKEVTEMTQNIKGVSQKGIVRNVLNIKEILALDNYVVQHYTESKLTTTDFANKVNGDPDIRGKLRFDINPGHIKTAIDSRDIPANRVVTREDHIGNALGLVARVQALEEQMAKLAATVRNMKEVK